MATTTTLDHSLFTAPFSHNTDFTELADHCERFAHTLLESDDPAEKLALCGRLSACLALLQPTLNEPIPPHLVEFFTLNDLPAHLPAFEPESDLLGLYCQTVTQLLLSKALPPEMAEVMEGLLYELVSYYADTLNAPRWLHTAEGRVAIEELIN
ncbi:hypothetical protein M8013_05850 [Enterobacteriaceae bacterium H4N4]|uniref:Uncharacterized protein n=1 Tax=Silvania confinis TaxID=2926470 RepID=A0A9J6QBC5_9ENTR|nr:hypothetical protein [Silvania confinis]MCU6668281.1 hypothetical protein [Silvania confinis]